MKKELGIILAFVVLIIGVCIAAFLYRRKVTTSNQEVAEYVSIEDNSLDIEERFAEYTLYTDANGNYYVIDYDVADNIVYSGKISDLDLIPEFYEVCEAMKDQGFEGSVGIYPLNVSDGSDDGSFHGSELVANYTGTASYYMTFSQSDSGIRYDIIIDPDEGLLMEEWDESIYW